MYNETPEEEAMEHEGDEYGNQTPEMNEQFVADTNRAYYEYGRDRGHRRYCEQARKCERFYMGGGEQWSAEDKALLGQRPATEINEIMPAVNTALAYQINNRMDIALLPRGESDDKDAEQMTKVFKQIMDNCQYKWRETEVMGDGLIQQRGYFDLRVSFNDNLEGEASIGVLDPLDVIPDPDAKSYDPDEWSWVILTRWYTLDEIEQLFGRDKRLPIEQYVSATDDRDWGDGDPNDEERNKFGDDIGYGTHDYYVTIKGTKRARVIDRQYWVYEHTEVMISPEGDVVTRDSVSDEDFVRLTTQEGWLGGIKKMMRRVKWCVTTERTVLFDEYSPFDHFSVVPFFPIFRRGKTRGMVDNAISPQETANKATSQYLHTINSTANSGWIFWQNSLVNMTADELRDKGAQTGLVLEVKEGAQKPEKIQPNQIPTGIDKFIDRAITALRDVTNFTEAMRGTTNERDSGVAIQARQYIAQQQLAIQLDNLARTRYLVAVRLLKIVKKYYTEERIIRITETNIDGQKISVPVKINERMPDGSVRNSITSAEYDLVITDQPMQVSWENSQFNQVMEMRKAGINLPDHIAIKVSNLSEKGELVKSMQEPQQDPLKDAEVALKQAQARKADAEATSKSVESQYSATTAANLVAQTPAVAPIADAMLRSAGYQDQDAAPIVPTPAAPAGGMADMPQNTHPLSPPNPEAGLMATPTVPPEPQ